MSQSLLKKDIPIARKVHRTLDENRTRQKNVPRIATFTAPVKKCVPLNTEGTCYSTDITESNISLGRRAQIDKTFYRSEVLEQTGNILKIKKVHYYFWKMCSNVKKMHKPKLEIVKARKIKRYLTFIKHLPQQYVGLEGLWEGVKFRNHQNSCSYLISL